MLNVRPPKGRRAQRTGLWAKSKWTNTSRFDPFHLEMDQAYRKFFPRGRPSKLLVKACPTNPRFVMPVSKDDVRTELAKVPTEYLSDLDGVVLLGGSRKQERVFSSLAYWGCYWSNVIFLAAYPKAYMRRRYKTHVKPSQFAEFKRAGVRFEPSENGCYFVFDHSSLRTYYLREVLMHELGHHVDRKNYRSKTSRRIEGFAEWFATEYGYRLRR